MIKVKVIFGEDAVKEFNATGKIPSETWLMDNGGVIDEKSFRTQEEYNAYIEGMNDADQWDDYHFFKPEITPESPVTPQPFAERIIAIRKELIGAIKQIFQDNNLTELDISDVSDSTSVIWWDNDNNPAEGQVIEVHYDGKELSLKVETEDKPVTLYESDFALESPIWLDNIYNNMIEILKIETE
ncbi:hypothetical protein [Bacteroides fragilis]|uniref:hypothetical protein n=1 Tax=Bacteroides fragilis TaxID=817 RepID=UPI00189D8168|nr:hypothetical protein [Bacteroides fragilis]